jgi:hypothetical protein
MPITPFLGGRAFDPEVRRVMGVAFVSACVALGIEDRSDPADLRAKLVASKIIDLSMLGDTDPDRLCERALSELRQRPQP